MRFTVDDTALRSFDRQLSGVGRAFTPAVLNRMVSVAARPVLTALRNNIPTGKVRRYGKGRLKRDGAGDGTYDQGGATRRDARIRVVPGVGQEAVRVLIGVSQKRGKTGFRTRFTTKGTRFQRANDFISRTEQQTDGIVSANVGTQAQRIVTNLIARNRS